MSEAAVDKKGPTLRETIGAFNDRRMAATFILSLAAGIPRSAVLGVLIAWLSQEGVNTSTIGIFSLVTIGYAFKYLWAPAFQKANSVPLVPFGGRRSWLFLILTIIAILMIAIPFASPAQNMGMVALICLAMSLVGPTFDLILDAWRIEVARNERDKDLMSAMYQFGYKFGGLISGFVALLVATWFGWTAAFMVMGLIIAFANFGVWIAPEPKLSSEPDTTRFSFQPSLPDGAIRFSVIACAFCWVAAVYMLTAFLVEAFSPVQYDEAGDAIRKMSGGTFVKTRGPLIVISTIVVPAALAAFLLFRFKGSVSETPTKIDGTSKTEKLITTLFRAIIDPLMDLVYRLRWWTILVILLALTYRFTDAVWGIFAYPFYLRQDLDALGHTLADVAVASKFFGVIATILGSFVGALAIVRFGRMPVLFVGGILAAVTNLLYADLALGGGGMDAFLTATYLDVPLTNFANWASALNKEAPIFLQNYDWSVANMIAGAARDVIGPGSDLYNQRMARLMLTIFAENIAGGIALVAMTAYLTSVVNPRFAAVQYALLASMTMLIGTLGQAWLGEIINANGFYHVFIITFLLGGVAVVLTIIEWARQSRVTHPMGLDDEGKVVAEGV